jgi:hypothetical protein
MTVAELEELKKQALEESAQPVRHLLARDRIRKALEPYAYCISDETIFHILIVCGGNLDRAMHKTILTLQAESFRKRNIKLKMWSRELLRKHEAGLLFRQS